MKIIGGLSVTGKIPGAFHHASRVYFLYCDHTCPPASFIGAASALIHFSMILPYVLFDLYALLGF